MANITRYRSQKEQLHPDDLPVGSILLEFTGSNDAFLFMDDFSYSWFYFLDQSVTCCNQFYNGAATSPSMSGNQTTRRV